MKELAFLLSLKNNLSAPLGKAQQSVESFTRKSAGAFRQMGIGAAGVWGATQAIKGFLGPAYEMEKALGEVRSLDVSEKVLSKLANSALKFSMQYGGSATDIVRASYDIQSAIAGLQGNELSDFTVASATLAKATKADTAVITSYMGTMYGIFQKNADAMGRSTWVKQLAGQTAEAVKVFKTSGNEMSAAFGALGAAGTSAGIGVTEQMAILGQLQATMSGSEAGTKYKSFLAGIGNAQKTLGLSFTNADGSMKGIVDILTLIQGKYGDLSKVADSDVIKKAFGSDEAVAMVKLLAGNIKGLKGSILSLDKISGMDNAQKMAASMVDIWERLEAIWKGMSIVLGRTLIPVLNPLLQKLAESGMRFAKWMELFPNIARWLGYITLGVLGFVAVGAAANLVVGISKFVWIGITGIWKVATLAVRALWWAINLKARALQLARIVAIAYSATMRVLRLTLLAVTMAWRMSTVAAWLQRAGLMATTLAMRAYGIATAFAAGAMQILMSPVTLIIIAIAALAAGIWYAVTHWDELKAALMDSAAFQWVMQIAGQVGDMFAGVWASIKLGWEMVVNFFTGLSPVKAFTDFVDTIGNVFSGLWDSLIQSFGKTYNWIVTKLNKIPGVNIDLKPVGDAAPDVSGLAGPAGLNAPQMERGGIAKTLTSGAQGKVTDNSRKIGQVNIYPQNGETFDSLMESRELAAG
jgi:hypothetical protein